MRWFSTRDLLDIAGVPFASPDAHPTRLDTLAYYRGVAERFGVRVVAQTPIERILPRPGGGLAIEATGRGGPLRFDAARRDPRHGVLRQPAPARRPGRGAAARPVALRLRVPLPRPRRRRRGRKELGGGSGARPVPPRRPGDARPSGRRPVGARQVLDQARPREPHRLGRHPGALRLPRSRGPSGRRAGRGLRAARRRCARTPSFPSSATSPISRSSNAAGSGSRGMRASRPTTRKPWSPTCRTSIWPARSWAAGRSAGSSSRTAGTMPNGSRRPSRNRVRSAPVAAATPGPPPVFQERWRGS